MIDPKVKLITIVGPTASGKTSLACSLAKEFNGEVVCADSRTIYRDMDIGTAKPTMEERQGIPHHLIDMIEPGGYLTVAEFKQLADNAINDIWSRGRVPFLVGGSGLYINAVIYDYQFPGAADLERRSQLERLSDGELKQLLKTTDPVTYEGVDLANRRRVLRAIERAGEEAGMLPSVREGTLVLGMAVNKEIVQSRIRQRLKKMLQEGLIDEVRNIGEKYGWQSEAMTGIAYRAFRPVVKGEKTVEEGVMDDVRMEMQLVKRQLTWFKRNTAICWIQDKREAESLVRFFLSPESRQTGNQV